MRLQRAYILETSCVYGREREADIYVFPVLFVLAYPTHFYIMITVALKWLSCLPFSAKV